MLRAEFNQCSGSRGCLDVVGARSGPSGEFCHSQYPIQINDLALPVSEAVTNNFASVSNGVKGYALMFNRNP